MPPKRKVLADKDANQDAVAPPAKRAAKASAATKKATTASGATKKAATATAATKKVATASAATASTATKKPVTTSAATKKAAKASAAIEKAATASAVTKKVAKASAATEKAATASAATEKAATTSTATKKAAKASEPKAPKARKFKYSIAETVSGAPPLDFVNVAWPESGEDSENDDEEEGDPKVGDILTEDMIKRVSKMGYPVTTDGIEKFEWMINEQDKRDQDCHNMYIYNDFSGYGCTEMLENMLAEFNKALFKKDVSPFKKWAFVEGLATFLKLANLMNLMMCDDSEAVEDVLDMFGTMLLTTFDVLSEHGLLAADSPLPNIGIISLLMIEFVYDSAGDFALNWAHEVVRALDNAGVELKLRKEVRVSLEKIDELREQYKEKESDEIEDGKNIYKVHGSIRSWEPDDDCGLGGRIWAKWNWKKEYAEFKQNHAGGNHYNLEKWSKQRKAEYTFGTEEHDRKMGWMMAGEDSD